MVPGSFGCGCVVFAAMAMLAPSRAARSAIASPMPRLAPVMNKVFPLSEIISALIEVWESKGMSKLKGKFALITGGNSGIGLATAKAFVGEGARVAITGRDPRTLQAAQKELGRDALVLQSDVTDLKQIDELFTQLKKHFGALDILFANAGIGRFKSLADTTEETFDQIFDINVKGVFFTVQKAIPLLRPGASIILDASIGARV